jgi:hypothetical protein
VLPHDFYNSCLPSALHFMNVQKLVACMFASSVAGRRLVPSSNPNTAGFLSFTLLLMTEEQPPSETSCGF